MSRLIEKRYTEFKKNWEEIDQERLDEEHQFEQTQNYSLYFWSTSIRSNVSRSSVLNGISSPFKVHLSRVACNNIEIFQLMSLKHCLFEIKQFYLQNIIRQLKIIILLNISFQDCVYFINLYTKHFNFLGVIFIFIYIGE